ncbi:hypothetical protein V494_08078 [Pseudogymnoascus sp. VKM F-4513 (FW-928)]|nr:hypothetical protein V494_08078 [Pseudogymnoascus sp. VKM F-4513 (FW-928)]
MPVQITEDYYMILKVAQTASLDQINKSYKRLALEHHPDRNFNRDTTEAFQRIRSAYDTLKDEKERKKYDLIYPTITSSRPSPQTTQTPRPPHASTPRSGATSEAAQIAALQKSKQDRGVRWRIKKNVLDSSIFELQRAVRQLAKEIENLNSIVAAEAAEEAQKNSWGTWLLSPLYKRAEETEEEKERKERERQERRIQKDMKERRLEVKAAGLTQEENRLRGAQEEVDAADLVDDRKIQEIKKRIWFREQQERREKQRIEREKRLRKEAEERAAEQKRYEEELAAFQKQYDEELAAAQKRREEEDRILRAKINHETRDFWDQYPYLDRTGRPRDASCDHGGWWPKVQGRAPCPECFDTWNYLLQCPGCAMLACPKCQAAIRPRVPRGTARRGGGGGRGRTPTHEDLFDDYY